MCHNITFLMISLHVSLKILILILAERNNKAKEIIKTTKVYMNNKMAKNKKL